MAALLAFLTLLTAIAFYFAFVSHEPLFRWRRVGAFSVLLVLTLIAAYGFW